MTDPVALALTDLDVFRGLAPEHIEAIARISERVVFRAGQVIIEAGEAGSGAYIIVGGEAEVIDPAPSGPSPVPTGSLLGEMAMLTEHDYRITVVARSTIRAVRIPRTGMHEVIAADPRMADHFIKRVSSRLMRVAVEMRRVDAMLALAAEPEPMALNAEPELADA